MDRGPAWRVGPCMRALPLVALLCAWPAVAAAELLERPTLMQLADDGERTELPLVRGAVHVDVRGPIGQVLVTQTYANPGDTAIEAIYVFPLPADAAIGGLEVTIGDRTIRAEIRGRDEARRIYEEARDAGQTAALLEQERPNVFTQTVANILPGEQIEVALTYDVLLAPVDGQYELALPTVVGPRYEAPPEIDPPYAAPGTLTGNVLVVDLDLDAGLPIGKVESPTHAITTTVVDKDHVQVALADGDAVADRDFVLRWTVEVEKPALAVLADKQPGDAYGHLALIVQPPAASTAARAPRELVFVVDTSGSMDGEPLALARRAMRWALERLDPDDAFRILDFSTDVAGFDGGDVVPATRDNVRRALSFVNGLTSGGGTEMIEGIEAALPGAPADDRTRYVCFMTDGYIGNEDEILAAVQARLDDRTHVFSFGVGSSVNRYLLDGLAEQGRGVARYLLLDEAPGPQIEAFFAQVEAPVLEDITVDWDGLDVVDPAPAAIGALFAGQPIVLSARYQRAGKGTVEVHARQGERTLTLQIPVRLPDEGGDGDVLGRLWARRTIAELSSEAEITAIALDHGLMSAFTSFVAVEERRRADGGYETVHLAAELPAGVSPEVTTITGATAENGYIVDGVNTSALAWGSATRAARPWRGSLGLVVGFERGAGALTGVAVGFERRLIARLAAGVAATVWDRDADAILALIATLTRWSIGGAVDLRLGLGAAFTSGGANGVAAEARAAVPLPVGARLHPELELRVGVARPGDEDLVGAAMGVGLRF